MRVIRTEMYFESSDLDTSAARNFPNPGISFAFFGGLPSAVLQMDDTIDYGLSDIFDEYRSILNNDDKIPAFRAAIDSFLGNGSYESFIRKLEDRSFENEGIFKYIYDENIIIEQSPPEWLPVKDILGKTPIAIGTFIGFGMAKDNPTLMLVTVPAGIIVIGAAVGISEGLKRGLNKIIGEKLSNLFGGLE
jgi:hypothetical protein